MTNVAMEGPRRVSGVRSFILRAGARAVYAVGVRGCVGVIGKMKDLTRCLLTPVSLEIGFHAGLALATQSFEGLSTKPRGKTKSSAW